MKKRTFYFSSLYLLIFFFSINTYGQDIHYSQFYNSPMTANPALTGVFNGDVRYIGNFRDQWRWVAVPWTTYGISYDQKIYPKKAQNKFYGIGGNFFHDRQGDSNLNLSSLNLSGSYNYLINSQNVITGGLALGFSTRGFSEGDLTWDKQWDGETFVAGAGSGETFDTKRIYFLETGLGLNYRFQTSSRTKIDVGVGAFHLVRPNAGYYENEDQKLPINLNFNATATFYVAPAIDIQVHGMQQLQGPYSETLFGGLGKIYVSKKRGKETQLHIGLGYRTAGSLIPTLAIEWTQYYLGASIDLDNTGFNKFENSKRGAFEMHFKYTITHVKPLKDAKVCPIY